MSGKFPFAPRKTGALHNTFPTQGRYGSGPTPRKQQLSSEIPKEESKEKNEVQKQAE